MEKLSLVLADIIQHFWNNYSDDAANLLVVGLIGLLTYIGSLIKNSVIRSVWDKAAIAVQITGQTIVDDLKEASKDGKLTDEEKARAKAHAREVFFAQFNIVGQLIANLFMGSLEKWFNEKAEYILGEIKKKS